MFSLQPLSNKESGATLTWENNPKLLNRHTTPVNADCLRQVWWLKSSSQTLKILPSCISISTNPAETSPHMTLNFLAVCSLWGVRSQHDCLLTYVIACGDAVIRYESAFKFRLTSVNTAELGLCRRVKMKPFTVLRWRQLK